MSKTETSSTIHLGEKSVALTFPKGNVELTTQEPGNAMNDELFCSRLTEFLEKNPLDLTDPIIVVTDKTRLCSYPKYLPQLIKTLEALGMPRENLRFIIAYGTHPPQDDGESRKVYGASFDLFPFIHHDCHDKDLFTELGCTSRGTPIRIRSDLMNASAVITMGPIVHHYFAGYGGGRKLIFPGCGEREAIYKNHGLYLDSEQKTLAPGCQPGIFKDNPLAEDLLEISAKKPANLAIHGILDSHGQIADMFFGNTIEVYEKACEAHGKNCERQSPKFEMVVASCGGFPKDINFIQSHKAIHNAAMFVEDGGLLIVYSECRDGIGSTTFLPWFELGNYSEAFDKLSANYEGNGGTALSMMTKLQRIRIAMVTDLNEEICQLIGVEKLSHQEVEQLVKKAQSPPALINNASLLVKKQT